MYTVGIINKSGLFAEKFKKSVTRTDINYIDISLDRIDESLKDEIVYNLIVILPESDGKVQLSPEFINFIKRQKYHIELLILIDLSGHVRNVESTVINNKQIPLHYYNSDEQIFNSHVKNYTVINGSYEYHYELIRRCNIMTTAEFAEHITSNRGLFFGKLREIKRQDHLDIDEYLSDVFEFSRYLNVAKTLGNPEWHHTEKLYGYIEDLDAATIGIAISEIAQTMNNTSLTSSRININDVIGKTVDPVLVKHFGEKSFSEILTSLKGDDWKNFVIIRAFDLILDVPSLLRNTDLPPIYDDITNIIISLKFDSYRSFVRTKIPSDDKIFLEMLWLWVKTHLDYNQYQILYDTKKPIQLLSYVLRDLEISFTSINGFRHLVNLMAEKDRLEYYIAMEMKTHTSSWVKKHAKIISRMDITDGLCKFLYSRYLQDFLKKYPEIWVVQTPGN